MFGAKLTGSADVNMLMLVMIKYSVAFKLKCFGII